MAASYLNNNTLRQGRKYGAAQDGKKLHNIQVRLIDELAGLNKAKSQSKLLIIKTYGFSHADIKQNIIFIMYMASFSTTLLSSFFHSLDANGLSGFTQPCLLGSIQMGSKNIPTLQVVAIEPLYLFRS